MSIVRKSIFDITFLRKVVYNSNILDLFCGVGSFSFEALSRGAKHSFMIDSNFYNIKLIKKTAKKLGITKNITPICYKFNKLPKYILKKFNLVFIDPPYNSNLIQLILERIINLKILSDDALIILETKKNKNFNYNGKFSVLLERIYGISKIIFLSL